MDLLRSLPAHLRDEAIYLVRYAPASDWAAFRAICAVLLLGALVAVSLG